MKNLSKHAEWLSLVEVSGPFISVSILDETFPQGLEAVETPRRQKLRAAYEEWREAVDHEDQMLPDLHRKWVHLVLTEMLEYDRESLVDLNDWHGELPSFSSPDHNGTFRPDWIIQTPLDGTLRLFITIMPPGTDLESFQQGDDWPVSLLERMILLCRAHDVRVGLLTDGERWMLVNAPIGSTSSQASWYARLWFQEPITQKAFQSLLGVRRCFGPDEDTLESLLDESLKHHEEVTDTLGEQVRGAVEVLVQCLDKADEDRNRDLLRDVQPPELYEAGLTVMMRLVFILCAEERGLFLLGDPIYDQFYAVSTLRGQLAEEADQCGPEVLERRHDAWARLLAIFRAIYGGIEHESLRMPALGGSLFDPDRFPFLEGRNKDTSWLETAASPLPIDNRTVLLLLNSLQILEQPGGAISLSYRALDVEQIGHVYEGLLEHTVVRVTDITIGLKGSQKAKNPTVALAALEAAHLDGEAELLKLVSDITGRTKSAIKNELSKPVDGVCIRRLLAICGGNNALTERIGIFINLIRTDAWGDPIVYHSDAFLVTLGAGRRETGTHYTPKSLAKHIVATTLEPIVYTGVAEGRPYGEWALKKPNEILDLKVCDPAVGSGAFLVQACRYLGEKLVEAWAIEERLGKAVTLSGFVVDKLGSEEAMPNSLEERITIARRLVAERCLYGVDINRMAIELAKLSIWLVTFAKGRPFEFLDHNFRCGDSLLGINRLEQLTELRIERGSEKSLQQRIVGQDVKLVVNDALELRKQLRSLTIKDINDIKLMDRLNHESKKKIETIELIANAMIGEMLLHGSNTLSLNTALDTLATFVGESVKNEQLIIEHNDQCFNGIDRELLSNTKTTRKPFHWVLEFPEVFQNGGFDAIIGNPPFLGGKRITGVMGDAYRAWLINYIANGRRGSADLAAYFFLRAFSLTRDGGGFGLVAVNTIAQGATRKISLDEIIRKGGTIYSAYANEPWPGKASVFISRIHVFKGVWNGNRTLNGCTVDFISSHLSKEEGIVINRLRSNKSIAFQGSVVVGMGFVISDDIAKEMIDSDPRNADVIYPYLSGEDINSQLNQQPSRSAICFWDWPEERAKLYEKPWRWIFDHVKPERQRRKDNGEFVLRKPLPERWWQYGDKRPGLYHAIGMGERFMKHPRLWLPNDVNEKVLACSLHSKYLGIAVLPSDWIYAHSCAVFASESMALFSILSSSINDAWSRSNSSSLGMTLRYAITNAFETLPLCSLSNEYLNVVGARYEKLRSEIGNHYSIGLTEIYNRFHTPTVRDASFELFRELQCELDKAVALAYGWADLDLAHDFYVIPNLPNSDSVRYTISESARVEVIRRLCELNHSRFVNEVE